jgi:hypothetical protein
MAWQYISPKLAGVDAVDNVTSSWNGPHSRPGPAPVASTQASDRVIRHFNRLEEKIALQQLQALASAHACCWRLCEKVEVVS